MKILLLGAYANGNVGDMYQADSLARALKTVAPRAEIFSISPSTRKLPYPANGHDVFPQERITDFDFLNSFDLMLIGGGGLLASSHYPLHDDSWIDSIRIPMCAVSLGAGAGQSAKAQKFIRKCALFSVRDEYSADAVSPFRSDARIVMDPILLSDVLEGEPVEHEKVRRGLLCIPAKLVPVNREAYTDLMTRPYMRATGVPIVSLNEESDKGSKFEETFGPDVHYTHSLTEVFGLMQNMRRAFSERYHGCILAMRARVPCAGFTFRSEGVASKIQQLYARLGLTDCLFGADNLPRPVDIRNVVDRFNETNIPALLLPERKNYLAYLADCVAVAS